VHSIISRLLSIAVTKIVVEKNIKTIKQTLMIQLGFNNKITNDMKSAKATTKLLLGNK
jgi:hypothetical protein